MSATCKSCGKEIRWLKTRDDKNMPVDAETVGRDETIFDHAKHKSHFATCPNANQHRRPR